MALGYRYQSLWDWGQPCGKLLYLATITVVDTMVHASITGGDIQCLLLHQVLGQ